MVAKERPKGHSLRPQKVKMDAKGRGGMVLLGEGSVPPPVLPTS